MPRSISASVIANKRPAGPRTAIVTDEQGGTRKVHLRRTHKKSHLGCQTCKQRRIKCDEKMPSCSQCLRAKMPCPYLKYTEDQIKDHEHKRQQAVTQAAAAAAQAANDALATSAAEALSSAAATSPAASNSPANYQQQQQSPHHPHHHHQQQQIPGMPVYNQGSIPMSQAYNNMMLPPPSSITSIHPTTITASFAPLPPDQMPPHYPRLDKSNNTVTATTSSRMSDDNHSSMSSVSSGDRLSGSAIPPYTQQQPSLLDSNILPAPQQLQHQLQQQQQQQQQHHHHHHQPSPFPSEAPRVETIKPPPVAPNFVFNKGMPNIERINEITDLERRNLLTTVNLVRQGFETEIMRKAYSNWMSNTMALAYHHECLFHSVMAFSFGFQALKAGNQYYRNLSDKHRVLALKKFNDELENVSPANTDALLGTSLILYWDAMYQVDTIYSYINMCRGLGAILEKVQINSSTTQTAVCTTESLAQAIKSILYPRFPYYFLQECIEKINVLEPLIMHDAPETQREYMFLKDYLHRIVGFLKSGIHSTQNSIYDPNILYDFIKEWISEFPCLTFSIDFIKSDASIVLYTFFDAVCHALDAVFPEARYLFQFSFIGPIDLIGIENTALVVSSKEAFELLEYPLRMVSFFKKRAYQLSGLFMTSDPLLMSPSGVPLYRSRQVDLAIETPLYSFMDERLRNGFDEFMPIMNPNVPNYMDSAKAPSPSSSNNGIGFGQNNNNNPTTLPPLFSKNNSNNSSSFSTSPGSAPTSYDDSSKQPHISNIVVSAPSPRTSLPPLSAVLSPKDQDSQSPPSSNSSCSSPPSSFSKGVPLPPLSSLSMGSFKTYFDDRLDILRHFAPNQPDIY